MEGVLFHQESVLSNVKSNFDFSNKQNHKILII